MFCPHFLQIIFFNCCRCVLIVILTKKYFSCIVLLFAWRLFIIIVKKSCWKKCFLKDIFEAYFSNSSTDWPWVALIACWWQHIRLQCQPRNWKVEPPFCSASQLNQKGGLTGTASSLTTLPRTSRLRRTAASSSQMLAASELSSSWRALPVLARMSSWSGSK